MTVEANELSFDYSKYGFRQEENYVFKSGKGLTEEVVRELSAMKGEPEWMLKRRLQALDIFYKKPTPVDGAWGNPDLLDLNYDDEVFELDEDDDEDQDASLGHKKKR